MLVHLPIAATPTVLSSVKPYGWIGVDLFFVLSGYLIGTQLLSPVARGAKPDLAAFYIRRSFRILPVFLFVLLIYTFVPAFRDTASMLPLWRFLTFTANFGLDARAAGALTEAWSLCVEEHFYLALPVLVLLLRGYRSAVPALVIASIVVLGGLFLRFKIWQNYVGVHLDGKPSNLFVSYLQDVYYPSYTRLDGLLFGVILAAARVFRPGLLEQYGKPQTTLMAGSAVLALALLLITDRESLTGTELPLIVQPLAGAVGGFPLLALGFTLILAAALDSEPFISKWRVPGAEMIATISYSLYLTHKAVMHVVGLLLEKDILRGGLGFLIYFASSLAVAATVWWCIERPFMNLRKRISPDRRGQHAPGDSLPNNESYRSNQLAPGRTMD